MEAFFTFVNCYKKSYNQSRERKKEMKQTKWLKKMSYTVAAFGLLSVAQTAVSAPVLYDKTGKVKASQSAGIAEVAPDNKLKSHVSTAESTQTYLDGMKLDLSQVKLADGRIRVTAHASNPKTPIPPKQIEYYWSAPSNSVDHYPASESEQGESSTFTFTMPATQIEKYKFGMMGSEKTNDGVYAIINTFIVPIESTQAYLNGLELNVTQTKLANGAIQVIANASNPDTQTSPKPVGYHWKAPSNSVDHHPALESERSKSSTFTFTMPATQTEKYDFSLTGFEKENDKVQAEIDTSIIPIGSTTAFLTGLKLNFTQSKLANGATQVVAKASNPDMQASPTPVGYFWKAPSNSTDHHPESESEENESSTFTFTMPVAQTENYRLNLLGYEKENTKNDTYLNASITPLKAQQALLNSLQPRDAQATLKGSVTEASIQSIEDYVDGLEFDVTQDKLASGETKVVVKAINADMPTQPTSLSYFWRGPKGASNHDPIAGETTSSTFTFTMPAAQTETYQFMMTAYDANNEGYSGIVKTLITPAESTQAFLNGLTLNTTQTKLESGATRVIVKANNPHMPTSPTPVEYFWTGSRGSTEHQPAIGQLTHSSTFEFTMPATQDQKYTFVVTGYEEGRDKVSATHITSIIPVGTTQSFLNGLKLHATQTKLESGATRVVVQASNPHEAAPPMPVEYLWKKPSGSTEQHPDHPLTDSSTFEFTMPAGQTEKYSTNVTGYQKDKHSVSSFFKISIEPVLEVNPL